MADAIDIDERDRITRELLEALQAFMAAQTIQSGAQLYASLQEAARSNVLEDEIQPRAKALLRELRRVLTGPARDDPSEVDAAKRVALDVHAWLAKRPDFLDRGSGDGSEPP